jgi:hypothetical protein
MPLAKEQAPSLDNSFDPPDQRICRLLLDNPIAKILGVVALAVQLVLPPLALEGTLNKGKRLGTDLIRCFAESAAQRAPEFFDALERGFKKGILQSSDQRGVVIGEDSPLSPKQ